MRYHAPVLTEEVIVALELRPGAIVIDGTIGDGGHAEAILQKLDGKARLLGIDLDSRAIGAAKIRLGRWGSAVTLAQSNFRNIDSIAALHNFHQPTAILLDLGLRSAELEESGLGFTFRKDEPLIMRFDGRTDAPNAATIVNSASRDELVRILRDYGEEPNAARIADTLVVARKRQRILTTARLVELLDEALPPATKRGRIHFATRTFQALRIAVNDELAALKEVLPRAVTLLAPIGALAVISFHSLEDRIVKTAFKEFARRGWGKSIFRKPVTPSQIELTRNPRSRSAKLRVFRKA
ncbi:16S rRNA (cytosine(1402)-N(4))-methyltransferase RsmH [Patescibacteria group bacterium]|nr:MAG: 16S rRNA (cytosine(1402)-N(4))-methyltransferase RsmH [Patescibacteria group bacterium]